MAEKKITVVISQAQGKNPTKRQLEEEIAAALICEPTVDVSLVPHFYDLSNDHTGMLFLRSIPGNVVVLVVVVSTGHSLDSRPKRRQRTRRGEPVDL